MHYALVLIVFLLVQLGGDNSIDRPYGLSAKPVGAF